MLAFRNGAWMTIDVPTLDPAFTTSIRRHVAAVMATEMTKRPGLSTAAAYDKAEAMIYKRMFHAGSRGNNITAHSTTKKSAVCRKNPNAVGQPPVSAIVTSQPSAD